MNINNVAEGFLYFKFLDFVYGSRLRVSVSSLKNFVTGKIKGRMLLLLLWCACTVHSTAASRAGSPLLLSPLLEEGRVFAARESARVDLSAFGITRESYAGLDHFSSSCCVFISSRLVSSVISIFGGE